MTEHSPRNPWHHARPSSDSGKPPFFFWLTVVTLGGLSLVCVCFSATNLMTQKGSEKLLRLGSFLPKLNLSHGERKADAFRTSEPVPNALAQPKERATPTPASSLPVVDHPKVRNLELAEFVVGPSSTPEPPRFDLMMARVELPPAVETCNDPVIYLDPCAPQRGDSPMIRNWKTIAMVSLMSAATITLAPPPAFAGDKTDGDLKKSIDALIKRIDELEKKTVDAEAVGRVIRAEVKRLEDGALTDIKRSIEKASADIVALQLENVKAKAQLDSHKFMIDSLEKRLALGGLGTPAVDKAFMEEFRTTMKTLNDTLARLGPTTERKSMSPGITNGSGNGAKVKLVNNYPTELLFVVNGVGHALPPRSTKMVDVSSGTLSYEVFSTTFGILERRATTLASGHTFNLSAQ